MKKRFLSLLLVLLTVASLVLPVSAAEKFSDLSQKDWYYKEVLQMVDSKILKGYPDGTFRGNKSMTVAEFITVLCKVLDIPCGKLDGHWAGKQIKMAIKNGWLNPDDLKYVAADDPLPRQLAAKILVVALKIRNNGKLASLKYKDRDQIAQVYKDYVATATEQKLFKGDNKGNFDPNGTIIRGAAATLIWRAKGEEPVKNTQTEFPTLTGNAKKWKPLVDKYGKDKIIDYFCSVVFKDGHWDPPTGTYMTRWEIPIAYWFSGAYTQEHVDMAEKMMKKMNQIEGFPGFKKASSKENARVIFNFVTPGEMDMVLQKRLGKDDGSTHLFVMEHDLGEFNNNAAKIYLSTECLEGEQKNLIKKYTFQLSGLVYNQAKTYPDSLFYYTGTNYEPSELDWLLMELQHNPRLPTKLAEPQVRLLLDTILPD